jgi:hypothetical protein
MTCNYVECNQVITESPNVKLTSSSVPTAAKKHSCQPDSAHLFSHTGWCAKKQDGNFIVKRMKEKTFFYERKNYYQSSFFYDENLRIFFFSSKLPS